MKYMELNEGKAHGSAGFPVQYYAVDKNHPQFRMPPHWHREFEILHIQKGQFSAHLDDCPYALAAGDVLFLAGGVVHRGTPASEDCQYECLVFDMELLRRQRGDAADGYLRPLAHRHKAVTPFFPAADSVFNGLFAELFRVARDDFPGRELAVMGRLYDLFSLFYRENRISNAEKKLHAQAQHSRTAAKLLDYIEEHLAEPMTLNELAGVCGLDPRYLCRFFHTYTSRTPMDYINAQRVERACREMVYEGKSVTAAAFGCGFYDVSYFSRVFKKYKGVSPAAYRRQALEEAGTKRKAPNGKPATPAPEGKER